MNQKIIGAVVLILVLVGLFWLGARGQANGPEPAEKMQNSVSLEAPETKYDFGQIKMADGMVRSVFAVKNKSDRPITVDSLSTSCMCTSAYFKSVADGQKGPFGMIGHGVVPKVKGTIAPGETAQVEVVFDPNAHGPAGVGLIERQVFLQDADGGVIVFDIKALVTA